MVKVLKASGELQDYSEDKIRSSLARAGVTPAIIEEIVVHIRGELREGMPTDEIYHHIFDLLKGKSPHLVTRYNLKRSIMELGPSGYPFEKFVAGVLGKHGYKATTNVMVDGECVGHEIDIIVEKDGKKCMIECKFHNRVGTKSNIRTALYTYARFLDTKERNGFHEAWIITNTKVTQDVIDYARCRGMKVVSWDYPGDFSLRYLVETSNLQPITVLENLSAEKKQSYMEQGIVFASDIKNDGN